MARPTRQARRERREQQRAAGENGGNADRARRPQPVAATPEAEVQPAVHHRGGVFGFIGECIAELKKVDWPGQKQVITGTVVVLVACTIVGLYLWGVDLVMQPLVERLI
ncbi:MAG: preprotein translocase subunit SecE [Gaiellaceae bacterium]